MKVNQDVSQQFQLRDEYSMLCYIFELEEFKDRTHTGDGKSNKADYMYIDERT